jgi:hypothetical protein
VEGCEKGLLMGDSPILAVGPSAPLAAVELRSRGLRPYWCSGSASPIDSYGQGDPKRLPQPAPAGGRAECLQELAMPLRELGILARGLEPLTTIRQARTAAPWHFQLFPPRWRPEELLAFQLGPRGRRCPGAGA